MKSTRKITKGNFKSENLQLNEEVIEGVNSNPNLYGGIYKELAELLGDAATIKIWKRFSGLNVTFPQKLYSKEYTKAFIKENMNSLKAAEMSRAMGLSERRIRQIITEIKHENEEV